MEENKRRLRITATGKVLEQLTMLEIIDEAEKYWKPLLKEEKIELGKAIVVFPCVEFNEVSYVMANIMPEPVVITLQKGWRKGYKEIIEFFKSQGLYVIETNDSAHRPVDEEFAKEVLKEVNKKMRLNRYN